MTDEPDDIRDARDALRGTPFLTTKQAAYYLGVSPRTLDDRRYKGKGPRFARVGRSIRYHIRELEAFIRVVKQPEDGR